MNDDNLERIGYALVNLNSSVHEAGLMVFLGLVVVGLAILWKNASKP